MRWPPLVWLHSSRARFQCTTCQPPVPRPSSTAAVLTTTRSPSATGPVSWVSTYDGSGPVPRSTRTRCNPGRSTSSSVTTPVRNDGIGSEAGDQALHPFVARLERVFAEHRALRLVVELQVHPVDGVVALALLGALDEGAAQAGPRRLRRGVHRLGDLVVVDHA